MGGTRCVGGRAKKWDINIKRMNDWSRQRFGKKNWVYDCSWVENGIMHEVVNRRMKAG